MAIMDELTEQEVSKNKAIRGYIIRALAKGNQNTLLVRQITNALVADGLIYSPDISKHIEYLEEAGYIGLIGYELFPKTTTAEAVKAIMAV